MTETRNRRGDPAKQKPAGGTAGFRNHGKIYEKANTLEDVRAQVEIDPSAFASAKISLLTATGHDPDLSKLALRVAAVLAGKYMHAKYGGEAWPSIKTLCSDLSITSESKALALSTAIAPAIKIVDDARSAWRDLEGSGVWKQREFLLGDLDAAQLERAATTLREAVQAPTCPTKTAAMLGFLLDSIPAAQNFDSGVYTSSVIAMLDLEEPHSPEIAGFSPAIVSAAVHEILRTTRFTPSVAEVMDCVCRHRRMVAWRIRDAQGLLKIRADTAAKDPPMTREQREALRAEREKTPRVPAAWELASRERAAEMEARRKELFRKLDAGENPFADMYREAGLEVPLRAHAEGEPSEHDYDPEDVAEARYR